MIVLARGGGSFEDLLPFSDERVVRAVAECTVPIVSAVGHEQDTPLCDLAADVRASTPTAAARLVVPDIAELRARARPLPQRPAPRRPPRRRAPCAAARGDARAAAPRTAARARAQARAARHVARAPRRALARSRRSSAATRSSAAATSVVRATDQVASGDAIAVRVADGSFGATVE